MKNLFFIIAVLFCIGFTSCTDKEEKTKEIIDELIDTYMFNHLPSYPDYQAIETFYEVENYDYLNDSMMMDCGNKLVLIDRGRLIEGNKSGFEKQWYNVMDTIRLLLETIDTSQQRGYFVTHRYRTTNYRGVYEIKIEHFHVNKSLDKIEKHIPLSQYEEMIQDIYLPAAFQTLQDSEFVDMIKNHKGTKSSETENFRDGKNPIRKK